MTVSTEVRELAAKAAAELRRRGWVQDMYYSGEDERDPNCGVCAVGAILFAHTGRASGEPKGVAADLCAAINARIGNPGSDYDGYVMSWNDAAGRTVDDVLNLLGAIARGE